VQIVEGVEDLRREFGCGVGLKADDEAPVRFTPADAAGDAAIRSASISSLRLPSSRTSPAGVSSTCRLLRTNSGVPRVCSNLRICTLSDGCAMCSRDAARPKWSSSATATK